ncbi:DeoR family transcriptional regulator [Candidatus Parcubacteria bacterium]|nr:DeoR family transcriptional regulator [Candidatus Parcubacteria bacterium]
MPSQKYTELTSAVYKILDFFPEEEPLKNKAKEKALAILENLVLVSLPDNPHPNTQKNRAASQALKDIEVLESYLSLGRKREWVDGMNLMILLKEYGQIKKEIEPIAKLVILETEQAKEPVKTKLEKPVDNNVDKVVEKSELLLLSERQNKILEILKIQTKAQVADFKKVLSEVTKRTLRRDLDVLLKIGKVERIGEWNQIFYQLSGVDSSVANPKPIAGQSGQNNAGEGRTLLMS